MIFVTVGTQFPFDRLVRGADDFARSHPGLGGEWLAQTGHGTYAPTSLTAEPFVDAGECDRRLSAADLIVCHAGMGTVLTALTAGTPAVVMPRRADLGEHRNDHQLDTAAWMRELPGVTVVETDDELAAALAAHLAGDRPAAGEAAEVLSPHARPELLEAVSAFVRAEPRPAWSWAARLLGRRRKRGAAGETGASPRLEAAPAAVDEEGGVAGGVPAGRPPVASAA